MCCSIKGKVLQDERVDCQNGTIQWVFRWKWSFDVSFIAACVVAMLGSEEKSCKNRRKVWSWMSWRIPSSLRLAAFDVWIWGWIAPSALPLIGQHHVSGFKCRISSILSTCRLFVMRSDGDLNELPSATNSAHWVEQWIRILYCHWHTTWKPMLRHLVCVRPYTCSQNPTRGLWKAQRVAAMFGPRV